MKTYLLQILILLTLSGCAKEGGDIQFVNLEGEFIVSASQGLSAEGPHFLLHIQTVDEQNCDASEIKISLQTVESGTDIVIENIVLIDDCPSEKGVVFKDVELPITQAVSDLSVSLRDVVKNKGQLFTSENQHTLVFNSMEGLFLGRQAVNRITTDMVFGYVYDKDAQYEIEQILQEYNMGTVNDGDYALFKKEGNNISLNSTPESAMGRNLVLKIEDSEEFNTRIHELRGTYPNAEINLVNAYGDTL